ncbi:MAG: bifunctional protein-serine/threonine kinase/phosphatase [Pseudomonadota bacterium]
MTAPSALRVGLGQYSSAGRKDTNQDFHGALLAEGSVNETKGIAIALADGISSSAVSRDAAEAAVTGFLNDYYSTPEAWSTKHSAMRVLEATNAWLHRQTQRTALRFDRNKGYVCTFSAVVLKSTTAHLFHVGDSRIYRLEDRTLEQLTSDHRYRVSDEESFLSRALGIESYVDIEYSELVLEVGATLLLTTDGVHEFLDERSMAEILTQPAPSLDATANRLVTAALEAGSYDNLTAQVVRIEALPERSATETYRQLNELPFPPALRPGEHFDGFKICRVLTVSARSSVFLAIDEASQQRVVLKVPSVDLRDDVAHLERFLLEEWIASRVDNPHVITAVRRTQPKRHIYQVTEYVDGATLTQWMRDNARPTLDQVRSIVKQIARALRALHRLEMLHQDLRPDNVLIDRHGTITVIDLGSAYVPGLEELGTRAQAQHMPGTPQYLAPEYFVGGHRSTRSDQFSLGVIAYQLLCGQLPYGADVARATSPAAQKRLRYRPLRGRNSELPPWIDLALEKATRIDPMHRYDEISEFVHDLETPSSRFLRQDQPPLIERNPVAFWQGLSATLALVILALLILRD